MAHRTWCSPRRVVARCAPSKFVPARFKPAIGAANQVIAALGPDGRPDPLPEELRLYDLRHTAASLMIRQGASVKAVQRQLGHATASITLDVYGHLFPDELDALADRLEDVRAEAVASLARTQRGPAVVPLGTPQVRELSGGVGGAIATLRLPELTTRLVL
jgi:integrase